LDSGHSAGMMMSEPKARTRVAKGARDVQTDAPRARLLDLKSAGAYLGVSYWTMRDLVFGGIIPTVKIPVRERETATPFEESSSIDATWIRSSKITKNCSNRREVACEMSLFNATMPYPMKPAELMKIRERLKFNQSRLAAELNVQRSTVSRWESGEVAIPKVAELAIRYLVLVRQKGKTT
jgi:DNA-binding transcriptional regulator YiaG